MIQSAKTYNEHHQLRRTRKQKQRQNKPYFTGMQNNCVNALLKRKSHQIEMSTHNSFFKRIRGQIDYKTKTDNMDFSTLPRHQQLLPSAHNIRDYSEVVKSIIQILNAVFFSYFDGRTINNIFCNSFSQNLVHSNSSTSKTCKQKEVNFNGWVKSKSKKLMGTKLMYD